MSHFPPEDDYSYQELDDADGLAIANLARRHCLVCGERLAPRERRVHAGDCARERERQLQQKRRQARRIARPEAPARAT